ncbi:hypothetical protein QBC42DRAFT_333447 [Cladorrhinum samala]|uniref:Uncharacterized protein n=1 Tax=Cladorrhinum samala TaxID=585594 RepID=A0AAV9HHI0_9PEZI|nr:hypothetical protein QBC42DRAFT_333447 [Cladorrhinum samala]
MERWHAQSKAAFEGGSFETLWRIFESMVQKLYRRNIYYAIDAFDKCEEAHWRKQLLAQHENGSTQQAGTGYFTPRPLSPPTSRSRPQRGKRISRAEIHYGEGRRTSKPQVNSQSGLERSPGTFLWVSFMIEDLKARSIDESKLH